MQVYTSAQASKIKDYPSLKWTLFIIVHEKCLSWWNANEKDWEKQEGKRKIRLRRFQSAAMDEWTIKTLNPLCRLFFKIDLLTDLAALCFTDFIVWRYSHSWLVFSTQRVNYCPPRLKELYLCTEPVLLNVYGAPELIPRNEFRQPICSLADRYENPIPPWCLAPIDFLKIPALYCCPSIPSLPPSPPFQTKYTKYANSVWLWGCWIVL